MQLPPDVAAALQTQQETAPSVAARHADGIASSDVYGDAVVAALVQMAVIAHDDALWKALNHQVCPLLCFAQSSPLLRSVHMSCIVV